MRKAIALILSLTPLSACAIGQQMYDNRRLEECYELPTPDERRACEREARDGASTRP